MPLSHGKSKKAFEHNIKAEMAAGKPMKQSLAIAYNEKRRAQKKAHGGMIAMDADERTGYQDMPDNDVKDNAMADREDAKRLNQQIVRAVMGMAKGDEVDTQMRKESQDFSGLDRLAYGGMAEGDMVERVMKKRYSEGGRVANDSDPISEGMPNEFDDLVLRDDLESTYGDNDNSGDAKGNARESKDRADIIAMIMKRRAKQHNPSPA